MAYRGGGGGGDRGDQYQAGYGGGRAGPMGAAAAAGRGGRAPTGFVWPPPGASTPRPVPVPYGGQPATVVYRNPAATGPHQAVYQHGVVFRAPAPTPPAPAYPFAPAPVTIRAPSPPPSPTAAHFQPAARVSAPPPAPAAPSAASVAKELEQKLFVSETALAPPAAAAAAAVAATKEGQAAEAAPDVDLAPVSKKGLAHPARPGAGTIGKKVMIRANHFLVDVADNNLFHYDVSINPESKSRATNRKVLSELIKLHGKKSLGCKLPAYDGRKSLYTAGSLPFESEEFVVTLVDPEKKDKERAEREYKITIRIAGRTDLFHLQQFLAGRQRDMPQETIQVLDVVLRESPSWNYVTVSRSFFSNTFGHRGDIGEGLECWRGYYQSLLPTQMGLSLNIDISATSFFKPVTVIQFVQEFLVPRPLTDRDRVKIKKALRGVRVETNHQQDQIRRYKITGITPIPMSQLIFPVDERGTRMTVVQYFMERYNYRLQYTSWPCLQSGSDSRPVYLPMEACKIVEGQRYSKKLNDKQATNILRATCQRPQQREQSIREMVLHNKYAEDKLAQEFGIKVCSDLVSVPARVLPPPMLKYHDSGREKTCAPNVGQWNMINKKMINGGTIDKWACISFSRMRPEEVHRFCCDLVQMCNATGMAFCPRPLLDIRTATPNNIENALRDLNRRTSEIIGQQEKGKQLQLLIVILPEISGSYGKIKKACETDLGIVSQCCLPRHASGPNKQYLENVALKINVKAGGRNTVLERAFVRNGIPFVSEVPTIIFGADVTPPPPGEDSASSIAAVVASMDWPEITKYRGLVSAQPRRQEIIEDLFSVIKDPHRGTTVNVGMIRELLIAFRRKTGRRTERIIFDRDGVTEGQFSHVLLHEMVALRMACASMEEGYLPPVTFVAVQKIQQMRLFPEVHGRLEMTDKSGNILPGTGVDLMICHPTEFDFYLCSHASIQLFIEFLNTTYSEQVPEGTTIGMLSLFFLKKINVILKDFYVESQSKVLSETEILSSTFKDRTIRICPRLRGGALEEKKTARAQLKNSEKRTVQNVQEKTATLEIYNKAFEKLAKQFSKIQDLQEQVSAAKTVEKEVNALKAKLNDESASIMSLDAKIVEWQGKVLEAEERLKAKVKERNQIVADENQKLCALRSEIECKLQCLEPREREVEAKIEKASRLCAETDSVRTAAAAEQQKIRAKFDDILQAFKYYMDTMDPFLERLEEVGKETPQRQLAVEDSSDSGPSTVATKTTPRANATSKKSRVRKRT